MRTTPKHWLFTLPLRLRSLFRRNTVEQELHDELQYHFEQKTHEFIAAGLSREEAEHKARREFGGLEQSKENCRDTRRVRLIETTAQDIRFGLRMLRRSPGFTAIAVLTLGLGIGANTAIFSVVNSFLLRPLPVKNPEQITIMAMRLKQGLMQSNFSYPELQDLQAQSSSVFSDVFAAELGEGGVSYNGKTEPIVVNYVSGNYFTALGVRPLLGRFVLPSEGDPNTMNPLIVFGYSYWQSHFGGDPAIIGKTVDYDGYSVTVVGITPKEFHGLYALADMQGYLPIGMHQVDNSYSANYSTSRGERDLLLCARLASGASVAQAQSAINVISGRLSQQYPKDEEGLGITVFPERFSRPEPDPDQGFVKVATLFLILAALVLVLACVNIANFLLVRATARRREMAIRSALGGSRIRLVRQLLTESLLLAMCGGGAGIVFGLAGSNALASIQLGTSLPVLLDFHLDWRVFGYAFAAALVTGVLVGIVPALRASRRSVIEAIRDGGRGTTSRGSRIRGVLVVAQVGGSLMLLIVAGLMMRSLNHAQRSDLGFDPQHLLNLTLDPNDIGMKRDAGLQFFDQLIERVDALPGVESASLAFSVPMGYYTNYDWPEVLGYEVPQGAPKPIAGLNMVSADYFRTMRIPLAEGRAFDKGDTRSATRVAIVNETMARKFWPNESAIGHEFRMPSLKDLPMRIIGVAKDSRTTGIIGPIREYVYVPLSQHYGSLVTLQVRTTAAPESMTSAIRAQITSLAPTMPVFDVHTMMTGLYTVNGFLLFELAAALAAILGSLGLILALVGVFGVISFTVSQRTNEIGIRMAMGAAQGSILRMILRQGVWIIAAGLLAGILLAVAISRLVAGFISGVSPYDPLTYFTVSALLCSVALVACYLPARRATRVDPVVALRYE